MLVVDDDTAMCEFIATSLGKRGFETVWRTDAQEAFVDLFSQVLMIAARAGLAKFGTVAIDGTKIRANASIDANHGRAWFEQNAASLIADAVLADQSEDGRDR